MTLEERIKCIICAGEIELDGEAYRGKYELGDAKSIRDFILDNLRGKIRNLSTGNSITLSKQSAQKLTSHFKDGEAYQKSLAHIPQIIENMQFLEKTSAEKANAKFGDYFYYITNAKINNEPYTILSTVGRKGGDIYYDHNVFKGTAQEVFLEAKISTDIKYSRLSKILENESSLRQVGIINPEAQAASTNKYSKNSGEVQDF